MSVLIMFMFSVIFLSTYNMNNSCLGSLSGNFIICVILDLLIYFSLGSGHTFLLLCMPGDFGCCWTLNSKFYIVEFWVLLYFFKQCWTLFFQAVKSLADQFEVYY